MNPPHDAWSVADPTRCDVCGREGCEDHLPPGQHTSPVACLPADALEDALVVAREGQRIDNCGIPYCVQHIVPNIGGVGFNVAYAKVGKTTFAQTMSAAVAMGRCFLRKKTT